MQHKQKAIKSRKSDWSQVSRRQFLQGALLSSTGLGLGMALHGCTENGQSQAIAESGQAPQGQIDGRRVVILGFDGMDPRIVSDMMEQGELPHMKSMLDQGGQFQNLASSNPPQSPTAWSSFATCQSPMNHGIFDILRRNASNYLPGLGFGSMSPPELSPLGHVTRPPTYENFREGVNFWKVASDQGLRVKSLLVPYAYPPDELNESSRMLCGLDVPDIRGTQSTYFYFSDALETEERVSGGIRMPLSFDGDQAQITVPGIANPNLRNSFATVDLDMSVDRDAGQLRLTFQEQAVTLHAGEWSDWMQWTFSLTNQYDVHALSRFYLISAGDEVALYMTCLQMHPQEPMIPISEPESYSDSLVQRYNYFKTIGWAYDTKALQQGDMNNEMFIEDAWQSMAWKERLLLDELSEGGFDLLMAGWTVSDRVSHMFWPYRDSRHPFYTPELNAQYGRVIEDCYQRLDETVGKVLERLRDDDLLMVMSDHGFHSYHTEFSVNTWLIRHGYLAVKDQDDPETAATEDRYLMGFDWSRSKAYGLGLGMIYLNLEGREGQGIVSASEKGQLMAEIREGLLAERDPETGEPIFSEIYTYENPEGASVEHAPDLLLGYHPGYQTHKASAAGSAPQEVYAPNEDQWGGEHAASDVALTPGILFSNQPLQENAAIIDLGVTSLRYLEVDAPVEYEGKSLLV